MPEHGEFAKLRGVLVDMCDRAWSHGWSYGKLLLPDGELVRIAGQLEGHTDGTEVTIRGTWKDDTRYGMGVAVEAVLVEALNSSTTSILLWFRRALPAHADVARRVLAHVGAEDRWGALQKASTLVEAGGATPEAAAEICTAVRGHLQGIAHKKALMEYGFTEPEATRIYAACPEALEVVAGDPYALVHEGVLPYSRVDVVVRGHQPLEDSDPERLLAAVSAALHEVAKSGSTCIAPATLVEAAADFAGVYPEAVRRALRVHYRHMFPKYLRPYAENTLVQSAKMAWAEETAAEKLAQLVRRTRD